jgi:ribonucleoside-diphosphate reductase alpha chain
MSVKIPGMVKPPKVVERFVLQDEKSIRSIPYKFGFDGFGEVVYQRTYSREITSSDGKKSREQWPDTVIRVVNGIMSIRKDWYVKHGLLWEDEIWQPFAQKMAGCIMRMEFLPPGRGLYVCGTEYMYTRGNAAMCNCGFASTEKLLEAMTWMKDMLMCGSGIGINTKYSGLIEYPDEKEKFIFIIPDSREGWVMSLRMLLNAFIPDKYGKRSPFPTFDYSLIRLEGTKINGFGGTASGPEPLMKLHRRVTAYLRCYLSILDGSTPYYAISLMVKNLEEDTKNWSTGNLISVDIAKQGEFVQKLKDGNYDEISENDWKTRTDYQIIYKELGKPIDHGAFLAALKDDKYHLIRATQISYLIKYSSKTYKRTRLIADIANAIGSCVVAGNVRRSSEIIIGEAGDLEFLNLKNYTINPERGNIGWMSNNTVSMSETKHFEQIPIIAQRIYDNGEPGLLNAINVEKWGRCDRTPIGREAERDEAIGLNPCGEIALESYELCNLAEVFPTRCKDQKTFQTALEMGTFYSSTVSLLPSHWAVTNTVVSRNRRIGVSQSGIADDYEKIGFTALTSKMRNGYRIVREANRKWAREAGVPESIRVTTVKPSGSISQLVGVSSGIHFPTFSYAIRTMRISVSDAIVPLLKAAGYPWEKDLTSDRTLVFSFPIDQGMSRPADEVPLQEQCMLAQMCQSNWSDNSVSFTGYFNRETEGSKLEQIIATFIPLIKSISLLPHTADGVYAQAPYQKTDLETYQAKLADIKPIDWNGFNGVEGLIPRGCSNDTCTI